MLILLAGALSLLQVIEFFQVDACLDGGGSYDYSAGTCDHLVSHPHVSFYQSLIFWATLFSGAAGFYLFGSAPATERLHGDGDVA